MAKRMMTSFYCGQVCGGNAYLACFLSYVGKLSKKNIKKLTLQLEDHYKADVASLIHPDSLTGKKLIDRLEKLLIRRQDAEKNNLRDNRGWGTLADNLF